MSHVRRAEERVLDGARAALEDLRRLQPRTFYAVVGYVRDVLAGERAKNRMAALAARADRRKARVEARAAA